MSSLEETDITLDLEANIDLLTYEDLKTKCKAHGIKNNIKKTEMIWILQSLAAGKTVPDSYYTKSWISNPKNKKKLMKGGVGICVAIILIIIIAHNVIGSTY